MRKMLKKTMAGVMMMSLASAALAGCGGSSQSGSGATTAAAGGSTGPISGQTLQVMISEEPGEGDALGNALKKWSEESGNEIKQIIISHDDMLSKFPSMAKNNDLPDLVATTRLHQLYPEEFVDMSSVLDLSKFNESALKIVGKSYSSDAITGIPDQYTTTCMFYNQDAFQTAGIEVPTVENPWTWDELYENAKVLQEKGGVKYGFAADVSRARYDILMYANGGSLVQQDGDTFKVAVNSAENVATLERFVQANNEVMPKAIWAGGTTDNPVEYFKNGDAAILLSGSWNYNTFTTEISKFAFGVMPTPKGSAGQGAIIGGEALAIPANGKNVELAKQFIQWLFEAEHYTEFLQIRKEPSVMNDISYVPDTDKAKEDFAIIQNETNYVTDTFMVDESSSWRTYKDNEYRDAIKRAVAGEITPQEALDGFAKALSESSGWAVAN